jgi:hypothetical protein
MSSTAFSQPRTELAERFLPVFDLPTALIRYQGFKDFVESILHEGVDFGTVPGSDKKTLLKPGAEKLGTLFGLTARYSIEEQIEDWKGQQYGEPLFYYKFKCQLFRGEDIMGEGFGSCSSWESKYRYRWVTEDAAKKLGFDLSKTVSRGGRVSEFTFAIEKADTAGQYGKPAEYWDRWKQAIENGTAQLIRKTARGGKSYDAYEMDTTMYRIPNADVADVMNTVLKMGKKRSLVDATLGTTNASEYFTQDVEDYTTDSDIIEVRPEKPIDIGPNAPNTQAAADYVRDQKLAEIAREKEAAAKAAPQEAEDPYWNIIKRGLSGGTRSDKLAQFNALRNELLKHYSEEEVQDMFVGALEKRGYRTIEDISRLSHALEIAHELYLICQTTNEQKVSA